MQRRSRHMARALRQQAARAGLQAGQRTGSRQPTLLHVPPAAASMQIRAGAASPPQQASVAPPCWAHHPSCYRGQHSRRRRQRSRKRWSCHCCPRGHMRQMPRSRDQEVQGRSKGAACLWTKHSSRLAPVQCVSAQHLCHIRTMMRVGIAPAARRSEGVLCWLVYSGYIPPGRAQGPLPASCQSCASQCRMPVKAGWQPTIEPVLPRHWKVLLTACAVCLSDHECCHHGICLSA